MRAYIDVTGKTEDEAIQRALDQLKLERDDVSVEILERAKAGFLGLGSAPAKVRVSYGPEEGAPAPRPLDGPRPPRREERPPRPERPAPPPRDERPAPPPKPTAPAPPQTLGPEANDSRAEEIRAFLTGLLERMHVQAAIRVYYPEEGRYKVVLEGQGLGCVIGRRGETLDAVQQLTSYAVNRSGSRVRIHLDAENYRAKREQSLAHLAEKTAAKVLRSRRSITLDPMNAYERHVIHSALQGTEGITTYSTGTDPNRRIVIAVDREKK